MSKRLSEISYSLIDFFEDDDHSETETFHEYTKLNRTNAMLIARRVEAIMSDRALVGMMARSWKTYPGAPRVQLPAFVPPEVSYADVVLRRRSVRSLCINFFKTLCPFSLGVRTNSHSFFAQRRDPATPFDGVGWCSLPHRIVCCSIRHRRAGEGALPLPTR